MVNFMYNIANLKEAATDLRHLLNRGYNRKSTIELVGNRWNLNRDERHILYRAIFSYDEIKARKWNEVNLERIKGKTLAIDTYNILITIESCLKGRLLIRADDDYIRDISEISSKFKHSSSTIQTIQMILKKLQPHHPKMLLFFLEKDFSRSGELAGLIKRELKSFNLNGDAETVPSSDKSVIINGEIVISNDRVVLDNAISHLNLVPLLLEEFNTSESDLLRLI
jgi:hypothetical protein